MGRADGVTGGKDGNMHFGDPQLGCVGMVSMLPDMAPVACGMAMAFKIRGEQRVAMTYFGEGSTANGQWHEAMNLAGVQRLPVVFMLENNQFAYSTPNELEFAVDPIERAHTYGFPGVTVDGNDVEAVFAASQAAAERARAGKGPTLIECRTMRMHGHGAHDDMSYVPPEMFEEWSQRDPIDLYSKRLVSEHGFSADEIEGIHTEVSDYMAECAEKALASPMPDPAGAREGVFAEDWEPLGDGQAPWSRWQRPQRRRGLERGECMTATETTASGQRTVSVRDETGELAYLEAISEGLREEMRRDETVLCFGQDIGAFGGAFKVTDGFFEEFGAIAGDRRPAGGERDHRRRGRRGDRGAQAGLRNAVRRLHLLRVRPARERRGEAALPAGRRRTDGGSPALRAAASRAGRSTRRIPRRGCCSRRG